VYAFWQQTNGQTNGQHRRVKPLSLSTVLLEPTIRTRVHRSGDSNALNPLDPKDSYSVTWNNTKLLHWPLMGGLLHLVERGGDWAGAQTAQSPPRCTKCNRPPMPVYQLLYCYCSAVNNTMLSIKRQCECTSHSRCLLVNMNCGDGLA